MVVAKEATGAQGYPVSCARESEEDEQHLGRVRKRRLHGGDKQACREKDKGLI